MSAVGFKLGTGWPPIEARVCWYRPRPILGAAELQWAVAKTWRPSGDMRVYRLRTDAGDELIAVIDLDPDTGRLRMTAADADGSFEADLVVHR